MLFFQIDVFFLTRKVTLDTFLSIGYYEDITFSAQKGCFLNLSMDKLINYFKGAIAEMRKVTWPSKKETYNYTLLVIGVSVGMALFLGGLDLAFNKALEIALNR